MGESDGRKTFNLQLSFGKTTQLPADVLPADVLERLRAGGTLTDAELGRLHSAAVGDGTNARLLGVLMTSGPIEIPPSGETEATTTVSEDGQTVVVERTSKVVEWKLGDHGAPAAAPQPATYYEALSGRPDPMRDFFVDARRTLNLIVTGLALAVPVGMTLLAIAVGESLETILMVALASSFVGVLIKATFPRTPFD